MKYETLKKTIGIKVLTGIILIAYAVYRVYKCSITATKLNVIPFMACCIAIVIVGFVSAAICEYFANKKRIHPISGAIRRQLVEGTFLAVAIIMICIIIYVI
ncbi:hypothetical protein NE619_14210 [Anaerovorax odorimutans]|uniref:Uncharacterized protein n=1 Tax=Anaerovorax odorimutans TaxID=109327 RepID=A0ABT1RRU0_9FIRM|nr:hypothetical protein [Anaerovorax odorimutans]MCQ4637885.1 hypothetical protein [Anaerovorax odorimutans]